MVTDMGDSAWIVGDTGIVLASPSPESIVNGWSSFLRLNKNDIIKGKKYDDVL